ncbi:phosphatidylethanolamine-binding protein 4 [Rhinatrema bivittatum]|uniref:phosphatidylethanolamine-binding protein 4 n=1 Tax=Rhinatrema bivittatum TaxID=194408 RepID=UPI001127779B|nr:phosphatidylethanolamine-binding protein 4 [Rhinatrema bivittatum]XP_029459637.1 phosphatidylethanolamine-binding protein 4 [Rhinatrema bivittatum]
MKQFTALVQIAGIFGLMAQGVEATMRDDEESVCVFYPLSEEDSSFCRGDLRIVYPDLGDASCTFIPSCHNYRERISREWGSPKVIFSQAKKDKKYVLVMVDPDAPNRADPKYRSWRHWLVTDINGNDLLTGELKGNVLSEYRRPTPPKMSGFHRYQFILYGQPANQGISLSTQERTTYGSWDMEEFAERFELTSPVAATQFLTKSFVD